jgi:hypothetical protein
MDRLNVSQTRVLELRAECEGLYPGYDKPLPGTALQLDDDVMWLDMFPMRVVWGHDGADAFNGYCPDFFGEGYCNVEGVYITDRAPADPNETPMPVYPQQQQQRQTSGGLKHDRKRALQHVLKQLDPEQAKKVREYVRGQRPELLDEEKP